MTYTIGDMAQKLNVAPSTLRYYDKEGLLPFVERSNGGVRIFKDEDYAFMRIRKDSLIIFLKCVLNIFNFHSIENIK